MKGGRDKGLRKDFFEIRDSHDTSCKGKRGGTIWRLINDFFYRIRPGGKLRKRHNTCAFQGEMLPFELPRLMRISGG